MLVELDARCIMLNLLGNNRRASLSELCLYKRRIVDRVVQPIRIDISNKAVRSVVENSPTMFSIEGNVLHLHENYFDNSFLDQTVNIDLPQAIRMILHEEAGKI